MESVQKLNAQDRAKLEAVKNRLQVATQHQQGKPPAPANDNPGGNAAMRQMMYGQNKTAPALSPTDKNQGRTVSQGVEAKQPTKAPDTPKQQPQRQVGMSR